MNEISQSAMKLSLKWHDSSDDDSLSNHKSNIDLYISLSSENSSFHTIKASQMSNDEKIQYT